jgi:hypothetical protein
MILVNIEYFAAKSKRERAVNSPGAQKGEGACRTRQCTTAAAPGIRETEPAAAT